MATPVRARLVVNQSSSDECGAPVAVTLQINLCWLTRLS